MSLVLIVDDQPPIRELLTTWISRDAGHRRQQRAAGYQPPAWSWGLSGDAIRLRGGSSPSALVSGFFGCP